MGGKQEKFKLKITKTTKIKEKKEENENNKYLIKSNNILDKNIKLACKYRKSCYEGIENNRETKIIGGLFLKTKKF